MLKRKTNCPRCGQFSGVGHACRPALPPQPPMPPRQSGALALAEAPTTTVSYEDMRARLREERLARLQPAWPPATDNPKRPITHYEVTENAAVWYDQEYDHGPAMGSPIESDWCRRNVHALLRVVPVGIMDHPDGSTVIRYSVPEVDFKDNGKVAGIEVVRTHDGTIERTTMGSITPDGKFSPDTDGWVDDWTMSADSIYDAMGSGSSETYKIAPKTDAHGNPVALEVTITTEWWQATEDDYPSPY